MSETLYKQFSPFFRSHDCGLAIEVYEGSHSSAEFHDVDLEDGEEEDIEEEYEEGEEWKK